MPIRRMGVVGAWCRISGIHWRVRERVLAWSSAGEGESTGKIYFLFSKTFFFFLTMIYKCKDQRSTKRENGQLLIALLNEKRFLARLIPPESINPRLH